MDVGNLYDVVQHHTHQSTTTTAEEYEADFDKELAELYDVFFPNHPAPSDQPNSNPPVSPPPPASTITTTLRDKKAELTEEWRQLVYWKKRVEKKKKKMMYMVPAANLAVMDEWVWRKYGRKPVKGSSFLRSYYKCTSADGCKARKHVEKCLVEPEVYLVSYIGEHTHPNPVQRTEPDGSVLSGLTGGFPVRDNVPYNQLAPLLPPPVAPPTVEVPFQQLPAPAEMPPMQLPPLPEGLGSLKGWMGFGYIGSGLGSYGPGF